MFRWGCFVCPSRFCWQAEGENGTPPRAVGDTNGSPVRLDNHFRYRQAHAGGWHAILYILSSIEFLKDMLDFLFFDPRRPWSATLMSWNSSCCFVLIVMGRPGEE
jgi:hypothetical protein